MTAAHVVADQTFLQVQKTDINDPELRPARVFAVSHECDLALLELEADDPTFYEGIEPMDIGELPHLRDKVSRKCTLRDSLTHVFPFFLAFKVYVAGFPVGGEELSITEGVVSRIEGQVRKKEIKQEQQRKSNDKQRREGKEMKSKEREKREEKEKGKREIEQKSERAIREKKEQKREKDTDFKCLTFESLSRSLSPSLQPYEHSQHVLLAVTVDAAINAGNSGGPVFSADSKLIGIAFQVHIPCVNFFFFFLLLSLFFFLVGDGWSGEHRSYHSASGHSSFPRGGEARRT